MEVDKLVVHENSDEEGGEVKVLGKWWRDVQSVRRVGAQSRAMFNEGCMRSLWHARATGWLHAPKKMRRRWAAEASRGAMPLREAKGPNSERNSAKGSGQGKDTHSYSYSWGKGGKNKGHPTWCGREQDDNSNDENPQHQNPRSCSL